MSEPIEGEIVDSHETRGTLALKSANQSAIQEWTPRFAISVEEAVQVVEQKRQFMDKVMRKDEHYGVIPGTGDKPALLKPGAELLLSSMGLRPELVDAAPPVEDWLGEQHKGEPFLQYRRACIIWRQTGPNPEDRVFIARAEGSCSSWEKKYRYRNASRTCPVCGEPAIIKGKAEYGGGWVCFKKKGGCGEKFVDNDTRITKQELGQVLNKDIADQANTILKMADKRALVAATLVATGCSDIFTQDIEDSVPSPDEERAREATTEDDEPIPASHQRRVASREDRQPEPAPANAGDSPEILALIELAAALPRPREEAKIRELLKTTSYKSLLARVVNEHKLQCGSKCPHLGTEELPL